jgi:TatD DNase family protein
MKPKNLYYIDFHTHYENIDINDLKQVFSENKIISLTNNINYNTYLKLKNIQHENIPNLYFAYGLYPDVVLNNNLQEINNYLEKIDFKNCLAIGEIGIDYKITKNKELRKLQKEIFTKQLDIAEKLKKPVIIHSRFATKRVLETLKTYNKLKVVLHWFSGTSKEIEFALDNKYYITLNYDRNIINNAKENINKIFLETDYPITYNNNNNKNNSSNNYINKNILNIKDAYDLFCKNYNIDLEILKKQLQNNFCKLFPNLEEKYKL